MPPIHTLLRDLRDRGEDLGDRAGLKFYMLASMWLPWWLRLLLFNIIKSRVSLAQIVQNVFVLQYKRV